MIKGVSNAVAICPVQKFISSSSMIKGVSDAVAICPVQKLIPQHNIFKATCVLQGS
jgi:hypothetical protein